jgi:hypothetical protein
MHIENKTPFQVERYVVADAAGRDRLVVAVKGTFEVGDRAETRVADEQLPLQAADSHYGEADSSSTRIESDLAPFKPATDVVMLGHAYARRGRATRAEVSLRVGPVSQTCVVWGDRHWSRFRRRPSAPERFERMPLVYERAFGGEDLSPKRESNGDWEERNPIGAGLLAKGSQLSLLDVLLPNIEDPANLIRNSRSRPDPAGFGFIGRHWQPRRRLAGTYDSRWERDRSPLLPLDFDERYHNGAHPKLITRGFLAGNEVVSVRGATPRGRLEFALPGIRIGVRSVTREIVRTDLDVRLDTVVLEPDEGRVSLVWRAIQDVSGRLHEMEMVRVTTGA